MSTQPDAPAFPLIKRGYDPAAVDERLRRLMVALQESQARTSDLESRLERTHTANFEDLGPHVARVLQMATQEADQLRADADRYAAQVRGEAEVEAQTTRERLERDAESAGAENDRIVVEARKRADELLRRTQRHADQQADEIVRAAEAEVVELEERVTVLRATHARLCEQVLAAARQMVDAAAPLDDAPAGSVDRADGSSAAGQAGTPGAPGAPRSGRAVDVREVGAER